MKERPILFNAEMVKAILSGRKTQTRRVLKDSAANIANLADQYKGKKYNLNCPLGQPGDQLWVRETFATLACGSYEPEKPSLTGTYQEVRYLASDKLADCDADVRGYNWRPSIHMPRWASRVDLLITGVRVERLNAISEQDARAEGITDGGCLNCGESEPCGCDHPKPDATDAFAYLWQSIYGVENWFSNPWVWVIEFEHLRAGRKG
ncbi:hypothetical protein J1785_21825 [Rahnella sp. SL6]|uniref:hypothetical protein n=1 Tax=Rahnella perminowiae TaxID=2816244 RepID=UPI001C2785D7|nr:hypothetical protein [Rahnella perminowiae]MBU9812356.1 hypothetical protein [Rahnella perminowiae]